MAQQTIGNTPTPESTRYYDYDDNGNIIANRLKVGSNPAEVVRTIDYNSNNKPTRIVSDGLTEEFFYGSGETRYKQVTSTGVTTYYIDGLFEVQFDNDNQTSKAYIGDYAVISKGVKNPGLRYLHKDRLGSVETITDGDFTPAELGDKNQDGQINAKDLIVEQRTYNVFGEAREKEDNNPNNDQFFINGVTSTGFTGHEHLQSGLIHMNGRAYDPKLGRFLSTDPFIAFPTNGQSVNPYSYVMNNPLRYTDPSGYLTQTSYDNNSKCETGNSCSKQKKKKKKVRPPIRCKNMYCTVIRDSEGNVIGYTVVESNGASDNDDAEGGDSGSNDTNGSVTPSMVLDLFNEILGQSFTNFSDLDYWLKHKANDYFANKGGWEGLLWAVSAEDFVGAYAAVSAGNYRAAAGRLLLAVVKPLKAFKKLWDVGGDVAGKLWQVGKKYARKIRCMLSCFVAGTQVLTDKGYVGIETLEVGDQVWATDEQTGESAFKEVTATWTVEGENIYLLTITNGDGETQTIEATGSHPFYVVGTGWVDTLFLHPGDTLVDKD